jgi:DNA-binding transcriptional regulator YiaG
LSERNQYRDSVEAAPGVVLDFDEAGRLLGIDLERASRLVDVSDLELHEEPSGTDVETARLDGARLRKERERIGLSQLELARKLSVSPNTVARWERGELKIEHPGMLQLALKSLRPVGGGAPKRADRSVEPRGAAPYAQTIGRSIRTVEKSTRIKTSVTKKKRG